MSQMTQTLTTTPPTEDLVVPFHCDRCRAQAKIRVVLPGGGDLVFCGHHAREYETTIREVAAEVFKAEDDVFKAEDD